MDGTPRPTPELREKWRRRADAAFERMYGGKNQEQLVTMTQREDMAVLIAKELAVFLLEWNQDLMKIHRIGRSLILLLIKKCGVRLLQDGFL